MDAHLPDVREAICACFDEYEALAKAHLTWLWREEPPEGADKFAYAEAPPIRAMVKRMKENDLFALTYTSGEQPHDAVSCPSPALVTVDYSAGSNAN